MLSVRSISSSFLTKYFKPKPSVELVQTRQSSHACAPKSMPLARFSEALTGLFRRHPPDHHVSCELKRPSYSSAA